MEGVARRFGWVGDRHNNRLEFTCIYQTLLDVTTTGGVIFEADSWGEAFLEAIVEGEEVVYGVGEVAEV